MQTIDNLKVTGELRIEHRNSDGQLIDTRHIPNLVVTSGRNWIASRMLGNSPVLMTHMAIGSGATAPAIGQTTLVTELARSAITGATNTGNSVTFTALYNAGVGTGALVEAGIFNAGTGGTMLARTTFGVLTKAAGDVVTVSWTITIN